jgi:CheY-like chemotaxis protein
MSDSRSVTIGLLVSRDLFFTSKVTGTAAALGLTVEAVGDATAALERVAAGGVGCLFLDLADAALDVGALFAQMPAGARPRVIAFGSHVATARLASAREAGCDEVLPRSRFTTELPTLLRNYLSEPGSGS